MSATLAFEELERVSDLIAEAIDEVGPAGEALFLSKLALALAHHVGEVSVVEEAIQISRQMHGLT